MVSAFALLAAIIACGGSDDDNEPPPVPATPTVPTPTGTPTPMPAPGAAAPAGTTLVNLSTGFMPDPATATGVAGGPLSASTLDPSCRGNIPNSPQHTLMLATDFQNLRVMVHSVEDATLVIRGPDGVYRCDDDGGGSLMPMVQGAWGPGTYQVWVGVFAGGSGAYTIGFSELDSVTATSLPLPQP